MSTPKFATTHNLIAFLEKPSESKRIEDVVKEVAEEMAEVTEIAKIIVDEVSTVGGEINAANEEPVSAAPTNITTAQPSEATKTTVDITTALKAKGIFFMIRRSQQQEQLLQNHKLKIKAKPSDELKQDNAKKQKLEEQEKAEELKKNLEIVPDDEDDVFMNVTPLYSKSPTIVDYKIYKEGKKDHF
uniref:Uncharacterized protein n=1 Tax=Tanacetum cinerariifolium TaxID=118510 RepID=A0A699KZP5_TANCI|nr:hypothetical protein [Tanacetum cinerariifolium]